MFCILGMATPTVISDDFRAVLKPFCCVAFDMQRKNNRLPQEIIFLKFKDVF